MRLSHYFLVIVVVSCAGMLLAGLAGIQRWPLHLSIALPSAILVVALHSMVILFVLIGSRLLREATNNCGLSAEYLHQNNAYFRDLSGLFLSLAGAGSIVLAAVLGFGNRAFGLPAAAHMTMGLVASLVTLTAIPIELRTLRKVEKLLDTARGLLDASDRERAKRGLAPVDAHIRAQRDSPIAIGLFLLIAPWLVYLYQTLIIWRGSAHHVSVQPWIEISAVGLVVWIAAVRKSRSSADGSRQPAGGNAK